MNLLMTLDRNYIPQLNVMLFSALHSDSAAYFDVYLLHDEGLSEADVAGTRVLLGQRGTLHLIRVDEDGLADAPTSDRYPKAIYYRIFCGQISAGHARAGAVSRPGYCGAAEPAGVV